MTTTLRPPTTDTGSGVVAQLRGGDAGLVVIRPLSPVFDVVGRPVARLELCPAGGEPIEFDVSTLGVALEMAGVPLRVVMWKDPQLLARLALRGLANTDRARLRDLDVRTRRAALHAVATGVDAEHRRLTQGRNPGLASMLKCALFRHADQQQTAPADREVAG